ncbi:hypothetical protein BJ878DRAFT_526270, partial [Calycina marina]
MAICWCVTVFYWILISMECTASAVVLWSLWMVVMACMTALTSGVFWNLAMRTLVAAIM